jgi:hypothetical protein
MANKFMVVHQIFEEGSKDVVVEHRFFGKTAEEALGVMRSHMKTDSFLRGCENVQHWRDIQCTTRSWLVSL